MKIFKPEDYPVFLTDEHIGDLIAMKNSPAYQHDWEIIKEKLSKEELDFVERKEKQLAIKKLRDQYLASLSEEERAALSTAIIRPDDFPIEMNIRNVEILSYMADAMPPIQEWRDIADLLSYEETRIVWNRISERHKEQEAQHYGSRTPEEQAGEGKEKREGQEDTGGFSGNLLQQELDSIALEKMEKEKKEKQQE